jgi:hypothetical protein
VGLFIKDDKVEEQTVNFIREKNVAEGLILPQTIRFCYSVTDHFSYRKFQRKKFVS